MKRNKKLTENTIGSLPYKELILKYQAGKKLKIKMTYGFTSAFVVGAQVHIYSMKSNLEMSSKYKNAYPVIPIFGIYPTEILALKKLYKYMYTAELFVVARVRQQPIFPSAENLLSKS